VILGIIVEPKAEGTKIVQLAMIFNLAKPEEEPAFRVCGSCPYFIATDESIIQAAKSLSAKTAQFTVLFTSDHATYHTMKHLGLRVMKSKWWHKIYANLKP
jgi:hypothetical protein